MSITTEKSQRKTRLPELAEAVRTRVYMLRRRAATGGVAVLAVMMAYGVIFGQNGVTAFLHKRSEARELQQQMQQLQTENDRLLDHVQRLQNDPAAIEHQAREELHYTRAGEVIITLPSAPAQAGAGSALAQ